MVLEYFTSKKGKKAVAVAEKEEVKSPVLTKEDEDFLKLITSEDEAEAKGQMVLFDNKKTSSNDAQTRLMDGADVVPLPMSPPDVADPANPLEEQEDKQKEDKQKEEAKQNDKSGRRKSYLAYFQKRVPSFPFGKDTSRKQAGTNLHSVADAVKTGESLAPPPKAVTKEEAEKEKQEITSVLDKLNLSSINNRAFSFSKESQRLFEEFTQILKDIVNGVPTAYDDLEKLLTRSDKELKGMYNALPPFLQKLITSLPTKLTGTVVPGLLAAASEKPGADGKFNAASAARTFSKSKKDIPYLKSLMTGDAVATALRTILNFLKTRFPVAISGTNVLLSVAVFLLLFVFWYCHKRGKEVRVSKENLAGEKADSDLDSSSSMEDSSIIEGEPSSRGAQEADVAKLQGALNHPPPSSVTLPPTADKDLS